MPRQCVNVNIIDDTILEISEDFNATLVIQDPQPPNINFGDLETRVIISDNDGQLIMVLVHVIILTEFVVRPLHLSRSRWV